MAGLLGSAGAALASLDKGKKLKEKKDDVIEPRPGTPSPPDKLGGRRRRGGRKPAIASSAADAPATQISSGRRRPFGRIIKKIQGRRQARRAARSGGAGTVKPPSTGGGAGSMVKAAPAGGFNPKKKRPLV